MKKVVLTFVGILLFCLIALGGIIGAFYDTEIKQAHVVSAAEETEEELLADESSDVTIEESVEAEVDTESATSPDETAIVEESTDGDSSEIVAKTLLGDKVLAVIGLKNFAYKIGVKNVQKIGVALVAICSFCEAIVILSIFKKTEGKSSKIIKKPKSQKIKKQKRKGPQVPIEGYRDAQPKDKLKF